MLRTDGVAEATSTHPNSEETELQLKKAFGDTVTLKDSTIKTVTQPAPVFEWDKLLSFLESPGGFPASTKFRWKDCLVDRIEPDHSHHIN